VVVFDFMFSYIMPTRLKAEENADEVDEGSLNAWLMEKRNECFGRDIPISDVNDLGLIVIA
jgi:hypothetical protein